MEYAAENSPATKLSAVRADPPEIERAIGEVNGLHEMLAETRALLTGFLSRALGNEPGEDMCAERQSFNDGATGKLREALDRTRDLAGEIRSFARALQRVA